MTRSEATGNSGPGLYRIFGLAIESELALPEAAAIDPQSAPALATPDAQITIGKTPPQYLAHQLDGSWIKVNGATCVLRILGIGRFVVEEGRRIVVDKDPEASFEDVRQYLFGSALGALLYQRSMVPLHVSAILTPRGIVAFTGPSGAGKSTLAARLNQNLNWPMISDDVAVVHREGAGHRLASGVNTVKLWRDALQSLDRSAEGLKRDLSRYDKFHAIQAERFLASDFPFRSLIKLEWGSELKISRLKGRAAFLAVLGTIYRPELAAKLSDLERVTGIVAALAVDLEVSLLTRPKDHSWGERVAQLVQQEFS